MKNSYAFIGFTAFIAFALVGFALPRKSNPAIADHATGVYSTAYIMPPCMYPFPPQPTSQNYGSGYPQTPAPSYGTQGTPPQPTGSQAAAGTEDPYFAMRSFDEYYGISPQNYQPNQQPNYGNGNYPAQPLPQSASANDPYFAMKSFDAYYGSRYPNYSSSPWNNSGTNHPSHYPYQNHNYPHYPSYTP